MASVRRWRLPIAAAAIVALVALTTLHGRLHTSQAQTSDKVDIQAQQKQKQETGGWSGSYLYTMADAKLSKHLDEASWASPYRQCAADLLTLNLTAAEAQLALLGTANGGEAAVNEEVVSGIAHRVPCRPSKLKGIGKAAALAVAGTSGTAPPPATVGPLPCCSQSLSFRRGTTDYSVFQQVFQWHYMRFLYALFVGSEEPKYILDAGANVGFSTVLFKLLWPDATIVSLEPDSGNFAQLQRNTQGLKGVTPLNAGLWGRRANITLKSTSHGAWGRVFREAEPGEPGMPAYSVQDIADMMDIPAFDLVKIDIEGAEGMVFAPGSDFSWIKKSKAITCEVHDFFAGYFGLEEVSTRIDAAFNTTGFTIVTDNEHVMYINEQLQQTLTAQLQTP